MSTPDRTALVAQIASAYLAHNQVPQGQLGEVMRVIGQAVDALNGQPSPSDLKPAVAIAKSITDEFIYCLEDGRKLRTLKRYLGTHFDMTPAEYRKKWGLPVSYPMVAPAYAKLRSAFAKKIGLGRVSGKAKKGLHK